MTLRSLMFCLLFLSVSSIMPPQAPRRFPIHVESLSYPQLARMARIRGDVDMAALIDPQGRVSIPVLPEGDPLLERAAGENLRTWRF
jgi:outer membrane biosynthesis protein TonB